MSAVRNYSDVKHVNVYDMKTKIMSYRDQEKWMDANLKVRLDTIVPLAMQRADLDCWVVACKEYNEDPIYNFITPLKLITARRTAIFVFYKDEQGNVKRYGITRPYIGLDDLYDCIWVNQIGSDWCRDEGQGQTAYQCLNDLLLKLNPKKIGLDYSKWVAFADGLSKQMYDEIMAELDESLKPRVCSAEVACVSFLETRTQAEMDAYDSIMEIANAIIDHAYSTRVIVPGVTTNLDVKYFMMQVTYDLGLLPWFDFECSIIRPNVGQIYEEETILPGDVLHNDIGIKYLGLCTDTQELAYILKKDETQAPDYLLDIMHKTNRLQAIVCDNIKEGVTGDEILFKSREQAIAEGINPCIYTHPIGLYGHAAGPYIGLWDQQKGVYGNNGQYKIHDNTAYSLELSATFDCPEFGGKFTCPLETDILYTEGKVYYLGRHQTEFHLVK